jgi:hypothetical protein
MGSHSRPEAEEGKRHFEDAPLLVSYFVFAILSIVFFYLDKFRRENHRGDCNRERDWRRHLSLRGETSVRLAAIVRDPAHVLG